MGGPRVHAAAFEIIDLGTAGGARSQAWDINNLGQVVGEASLPPNQAGNEVEKSFVYGSGSGLQWFDAFGGFGQADAINDAGYIAGSSYDSEAGSLRGYVYDPTAAEVSGDSPQDENDGGPPGPGTLRTIQPLSNDSFTVAYDVNASGKAVGFSQRSTLFPTYEAILWDPDAETGTRALGYIGDRASTALAINDSDQVVGFAEDTNGTDRAFLWTEQNGMRLIDEVGDRESRAFDINNAGLIAGSTRIVVGEPPEDPDPPQLQSETGQPEPNDFELPPDGPPAYFTYEAAFLYDSANDTLRTDIFGTGTNGESSARGINSAGDAVGFASDFDEGTSYAAAYLNGGRYDLNDLIPEDSGWRLTQATAINDGWQIVGYGVNPDGDLRGFLLNPEDLSQLNDNGPPPALKQNDERWDGQKLLGSSLSIGDYGCFLTSTTMVLNSFGHAIRPDQLNDAIVQYFEENGIGKDGIMRWYGIPRDADIGQSNGVPGIPVTFETAKVQPGQTQEQITAFLKGLIDENGPVILRVPWVNKGLQGYASGTYQHAVVAWRVDDDGNIFIRDPDPSDEWVDLTAEQLDALTLADYIDLTNSKVADSLEASQNLGWLSSSSNVIYAKPKAQNDGATVRGTSNSPIDFVITDPLGRRVGYDPTIDNGDGTFGAYLLEIPGSTYFREANLTDPDDNLAFADGDYLPVNFTLGEALVGDYAIEVFGRDEGGYTVLMGIDGVLGFDPDQFTFSGVAGVDSVDSFDFGVTTVVPEPGSMAGLLVLMAGAFTRRQRS